MISNTSLKAVWGTIIYINSEMNLQLNLIFNIKITPEE